MAVNPQEQARLQALVNASPSVQAVLRNSAAFTGPHADIERFTAIQNALRQEGMQIPQGYAVGADGKVGQGRNMLKTAALSAALAIGAPLTVGATLGAFAPAALTATAAPTAAAAPITAATATGAGLAPTVGSEFGASIGGNLGKILGITSGTNGFSVGDIVKSALGPAINAGLGIYTANKQSKLTTENLAAQTAAEKYAADLQAKSAAEQLAFLTSQEATRKAEFDKTQALNLDQYNQGQQRLAPYRQMGQNALSLFGRPIGNVGSIMGVA